MPRVSISIWVGNAKALDLPANSWLEEVPLGKLMDMARGGWVISRFNADRCLNALRRNPQGIDAASLDAIRECQAAMFLEGPNGEGPVVWAIINATDATEFLTDMALARAQGTRYGRAWPLTRDEFKDSLLRRGMPPRRPVAGTRSQRKPVAARTPEKLPDGFLTPRRVQIEKPKKPLPNPMFLLIHMEAVLKGAEQYVDENDDGPRYWAAGVLEEARRVVDELRGGPASGKQD